MKKHLLFLFVVTLTILSCNNNAVEELNPRYIYSLNCDMESASKHNSNNIRTTIDSISIPGIDQRNTRYARSGKHSLLSNEKREYVLMTTITNAKVDDHFVAHIWRYNSDEQGSLVATTKNLWKATSTAIRKDENGWELLELDFHIHPNCTSDTLKVFFQNKGKNEIYLDDFSIHKMKPNLPNFEQEALILHLDTAAINTIKNNRIKAFENKMLITDVDSYVKAKMSFDENNYKGKLRLKGDWLDHLEGIKWSFRVKLKKSKSWRGMRSFNLQTPQARFFLHEWLAHKIAYQEDIITTRYDFIPVYLNETSLGIYVYEEHFEKNIIEYNQRREGPILKFSEDHLWQMRKFNQEGNYPAFEASAIAPFKRKKTLSNDKLAKDFDNAARLLQQLKDCNGNPAEIVDIDKTAKFLAFSDFIDGQHGLIWHNLRFYYNPVIARLEPIAYDLYSDQGPMKVYDRTLIGDFNISEKEFHYNGLSSLEFLFKDKKFMDSYIHYLEKFSSTKYLTSILEEYKSELDKNELMIQKEFPSYQFDVSYLSNQQKRIRKDLPALKSKVSTDIYNSTLFQAKEEKLLSSTKYIPELLPYFIQIYQEKSGYVVKNYSPFNLSIVKYTSKNEKKIELKEKINLLPYSNFPSCVNINITDSIKSFEILVKNQTIPIEVSVNPWSDPKSIAKPVSHLLPNWVIPTAESFIIKSGNYTTTNPILIPEGKSLIINAGVKINFKNNSYLWSKTAVEMIGTHDNPITIYSSDHSANGINIIQTNKESSLQHVHFIDMNCFRQENWTLTGAVTFYESDVTIANCRFENNHCEDALNIIRSTFNVDSSYFEGIYSDAFDSDFCEGTLCNSTFEAVDNDAVDFSGSNVLISNCSINNIKDKAISGGESSSLTIDNCSISNCMIGLASKDNSTLVVNNISISDCKFGLVAFQKKPEYGPSVIDATAVKMKTVETQLLIEKLSTITIDKKLNQGTEDKVYKLFY